MSQYKYIDEKHTTITDGTRFGGIGSSIWNEMVELGLEPDPYADPVPIEEKIAADRFVMEVAGVDYNGYIIKTDRESQQTLDSTIDKVRRGLLTTVNWKCANGWIVIDSTNIDEIELLVLNHVNGAFEWEKQQLDAL